MLAAVIATFFAALVIAKSFDEFRRGREPWPVFMAWFTMWSAVVVIAVFPELTDWVRERLFGPQSGLGTIFGIAIVLLLFLSYRIYLKAERVERTLNQLISDLALHELDKGRHDK
ncbi:DUF2304 family protein [Candidatus Berkelbacteria bacterium]|nr:DUF2304 family protein [Candidatus Berkelbacteria bacterium]